MLRQRVAASNLLRSIGAVKPIPGNNVGGGGRREGTHSSSLPKLSNLANLTTGAVARAGAGFVLMPMTVIKVRYESSFYGYNSIPGAARDIFLREGVRGFFSGFGVTAMRDAPAAGLYVLFYEQLKKRLSVFSAGREQAAVSGELPIIGRTMNMSSSASINFGSGVLAAGLATAITNPFDAIKTRIQLQPREYPNMVLATKKMLRNDGLKSLFDGLGLRMGRKAISSALAWTIYEELIRRTESAWEKTSEGEVL